MSEHRFTGDVLAAVAAGDANLAEQLDVLGEIPPEYLGAFDFVDASSQFRPDAEKCVVINNIPARVLKGGAAEENEYLGYLYRELKRQDVIFEDRGEREDAVIVRFPGRPEEFYSAEAFLRSMREIIKMQKKEAERKKWEEE